MSRWTSVPRTGNVQCVSSVLQKGENNSAHHTLSPNNKLTLGPAAQVRYVH